MLLLTRCSAGRLRSPVAPKEKPAEPEAAQPVSPFAPPVAWATRYSLRRGSSHLRAHSIGTGAARVKSPAVAAHFGAVQEPTPGAPGWTCSARTGGSEL